MNDLTPPTFDGQQWSNAADDPIRIEAPREEWPQRYDEEAARIRDALAERGIAGVRLEHFGSTAVPGLAAKPIIDILLIPPLDADWQRLVEPLEALGYQFWRSNPATQRMFFVKGMPPFGQGRTHHVHVMGLDEADRHLLFRDYLRTHPEDAQAYACLKHELAERYPHDREAYTRGKDAFVATLLGRQQAAMSAPDQGGPVIPDAQP
ncbi:GrpB family protein [Pseudomonas indica]|uniref:GrpB domain, predicted nucleotidyltransferase, UPF0157 family n=1 Tax=Pseudomonas indica TaxID=137658 RepID=A0A1G9MSD6_9PSED|nr:GrpB family protein [Pseudomonas indica]SDL77160.1 GrpB domain, predicted nucleotidyltransferase, UPF0157 family [Pseudomonas indica]